MSRAIVRRSLSFVLLSGVVSLTLAQPVALASPPHDAAPDDEKRVAAKRLQGEADALAAHGAVDSSKQALERYAAALTAWRELGNRREEAATLGRMSDMLGKLSDLREALVRADEALTVGRLLGDRRGEAAALSRVGLAHSELGDQRQALDFLEKALALRRADGDVRGQAETLNDIAVARGALGEIPEAVARYTEAIDSARASGDRHGEAMILANRAVDYRKLGETDRALVDLRAALAGFQALGDRHQQGITEYHIGAAYKDRQEFPRALRHYKIALALLRESGDKRFEGLALNHIGLTHLAAGKPGAALPYFRLSWERLHASSDRRNAAILLTNLGRAQLDLGHTREARNQLRAALPKVQGSGDRVHEGVTLVHLARAERALGDLEAARERLEEALRLTESLRQSIPGPGLRASFMATTRERYELLIEVLMDLHAKQPDRGWDAEALHASERAKARSLIETLAEARINLHEGLDEGLLAQERTLNDELEALRREEQRRVAGVGPQASRSGRRPEVVLAEYQDVQERLRAANPRYAALARPKPLALAGIRRQVLDHDTLLLEYALGEKRSFLWAATLDKLTSHELPRRAVVEAAVRALHRAWSAGGAIDSAETKRRAQRLSRLLLGPVAGQLRKNVRLAIVAEGALQYLPFAALPSPGTNGALLVADHSIVSLPSATTLAVLREQVAGRAPPERRVAVLADPVFDGADARIPSAGRRSKAPTANGNGRTDLTRSMRESGLFRLQRLFASRQEAEAVAALSRRGESFVALDFQASRETALGPDVARAGVVHFASHALLNTRHPELSGIVLSLVDEHGRVKDGFLQTRDIYKLRLAADLVVLSACQTALGKEVRGEGLLGLSRAFMYAGAPRILASLWKVPDRPTAELMKAFYRGTLTEGLSPAAALGAAQQEIRRQKLWTSPYYWAGFTLQGDWR